MPAIISTHTDADGILVSKIDVPGRSVNVLSPQLLAELASVIDAASADAAVKGLLLTSGKTSFLVGADIHDMMRLIEAGVSVEEATEYSVAYSSLLRRLETFGKPVAAAINGHALGGGLELCLACHYRVLSDDRKTHVGLPEVSVGLCPGGGGTQRLPRLLGIHAALPILLEGKPMSAARALSARIVHAIASPSDVIDRAREWLVKSADPTQPWDKQGFTLPGGGPMSPEVAQHFTLGVAAVAKTTQRNYPAPAAILSAVFEGTQLPIDLGLAIESQYFAALLTSPVSRNLMRTMFVNKGLADKLVRRPSDIPKSRVRKVGIVGAGMMGAGIAHASAAAGIEVVLLDISLAQADKAISRSAALLDREVTRGNMTSDERGDFLARLRASSEYSSLAGCELVIEAVFEDRYVKNTVIANVARVLAAESLVASNTSTLPISGLAEAWHDPTRFIGVHFFSPAEKMPLVEIIVGKRTSAATLAKALDYIGQLKKTPIVVNDSRGFYTSRVFGTFTQEGMQMLDEGINPALIENVARQAGMPVGPLAVSDEVTLELQYNILKQTESDLASAFAAPPGYAVLRRMVEECKRPGRRSGHGFYEYPSGERKYLWPGLSDVFPLASRQPSAAEVRRRLLYTQSLESTRCLEEGVVTDAADADLGSILGWGFPAYTGGTLSFVDTIGIRQFVDECTHLAAEYGSRFEPSPWLIARAEAGRSFYGSQR